MGMVSEKEAAADGSGPGPQVPVLRINQLDALELDSALEQLLWTQFSKCFQNFRPGLLTPLEPELKVLLHLLLWRFTLYSNNATVGQSLLSLRYHGTADLSCDYRPLTTRQKLSLAVLTAGVRWLQERSYNLLSLMGCSQGHVSARDEGLLQKSLRSAVTVISGVTKLASLINFLMFLRSGRHSVLAERITDAQVVFSKPNVVRDMNYQYMVREMLWHSFAEFLIFLLPLVNTVKLKESLRSFVFGRVTNDKEGTREGRDTWKECGLCGEWPTMPHSVGCRHVFCYYCIRSHCIDDAAMVCPKCGAEGGVLEPARMEMERIGM
ncbi:peroxisome biogenesis factor 2 isoform X2 [Gouania willdenowi]|uniref:peroxisome biogenesis factor 2 isoform X2 n=1 Tax=Gouania willdenowi TaxID=441366 RepID=UPI001054A89A|nr:peroxisome biogenesis factor 2 isoform X2 [Gouania willdenowi]